MDIDCWPAPEPPAEEQPTLLAVDTNVLINRLALVQALHKRLLASSVWLFVPHVVVRELDHQKSAPRADLRGAAQRASAWLRDTLQRARHTRVRVRLESLPEYRAAQAAGDAALELRNDERILRSLVHHASIPLSLDSLDSNSGGAGGVQGGGGGGVRLWTEDVNFALMAEAAGLGTVGKCVTLAGVLAALGMEDVDEGMELDLDAGADLFVRLPGSAPGASSDNFNSTATTHAPAAGYATSTRRNRVEGTRSAPPAGAGAGAGGAFRMPPPGTLAAMLAQLASPCPAALRPAVAAALAAFAARYGFPIPAPGPDDCLDTVRRLVAAVDDNPALTIREQGRLLTALRTLGRFVGPREKGERLIRSDEVKEAVGVLDDGRGEWGAVLAGLD